MGFALLYPSYEIRLVGWVEERNPPFVPMANYRRNFVPGGSFFFTVNLADRRSCLLIDRIDPLRAAIREIRERFPFSLDAIVVLPNHLHAIWTLADTDTDYATRWRMIKSAFSRGIEPAEPRSRSRIAKRERGIWQRRYWEHTLKDERDFERHCDYIHFNPVKHGYVGAANEWAFSSFRRFVERGIYPMDWGGSVIDDDTDFGER